MRALALVLAVALATKLLVVWAPATDLVSLPGADLVLQRHGEEFSRGDIAVAVSEGPLMAVIDYQWVPGFGGSLVTGLLAIPSFALFGRTLLALKLVPIGFALLGVGAAFMALERLVSLRAAVLGGLLLALAAPSFTVLSTVAWGTHVELSSIALVVLYLQARIWTGCRGRFAEHALLGFAAGFGVYFGYSILLALAVLAALEFARDKLVLLRRGTLYTLIGAAVGFSPWVLYNLRHDLTGLNLYDESLGSHLLAHGPVELGVRAVELFAGGYSEALGFRDLGPLPGPVLAHIAWLLFVMGFTSCAWYLRDAVARVLRALVARRAELGAEELCVAFLAYPLAFTIVYAGSDFLERASNEDLSRHRYVMLVLPWALLAVAVGLDRAWSEGGRIRRLAQATVGAFLLVGLLGVAPLVQPDQAGVFAREPGHLRTAHGRWLVLRWAREPEQLHRVVMAIERHREGAARKDLYSGMAGALVFITGPDAHLDELDSARLRDYGKALDFLRGIVPEDVRPLFEEG